MWCDPCNKSCLTSHAHSRVSGISNEGGLIVAATLFGLNMHNADQIYRVLVAYLDKEGFKRLVEPVWFLQVETGIWLLQRSTAHLLQRLLQLLLQIFVDPLTRTSLYLQLSLRTPSIWVESLNGLYGKRLKTASIQLWLEAWTDVHRYQAASFWPNSILLQQYLQVARCQDSTEKNPLRS